MYVARTRRSVCIIDTGLPRNRFAAHSHGVLSRDGSEPGTMLATARSQVAAYPTATFIDGEAVSAAKAPDGFSVSLATGEAVESTKLVLAFGISVGCVFERRKQDQKLHVHSDSGRQRNRRCEMSFVSAERRAESRWSQNPASRRRTRADTVAHRGPPLNGPNHPSTRRKGLRAARTCPVVRRSPLDCRPTTASLSAPTLPQSELATTWAHRSRRCQVSR